MVSDLNYNIVPSIIILLYYLCDIYYLFQDGLFSQFYLPILGLIAFILLLFGGQHKIPFYIFLLMIIFILTNTLINLDFPFRPLNPICWLLLSLLIINRNVSVWSIKIPYYSFSLIYIYMVFILHKDPNNIFIEFSRNYVSVYLLKMGILLEVLEKREKGNFTLFPAALCFILCLSAVGRSGIITSGMFFIVILFSVLKKSRHKVVFFCVFVIVIVCSIIIFYDYFFYFTSYVRNDGLDYGSDPRSLLLDEYIDILKRNPLFIFSGVKAMLNTPMYSHYGYNWHNSYIYLHSTYTLLGFFLVFFLYCIVFWIGVKNKYFSYLGLICILSLRMFTDTMAFPGSVDITIYYLFYLVLSKEGRFSSQLSYK